VRRPSASPAIGTLALAALALVACGPVPQDPPNLVLIVMDTARPDYMSVYGYERPTTPFLEQFAAQGRRFDRAWSVSSWTLPSHASMLTGRLPAAHGAYWHRQEVSQETPLIAERLHAAGYQTAGFSTNILVSHQTGFDRGFDRFDPPFVLKDPELGSPHRVLPTIESWLADERDPERPFFLFVNLIDPHLPYLPPWEMAAPFFESRAQWQADIERFFPSRDPRELLNRHYRRERPLGDEEWQALVRLYEGDLRWTDAIAGGIVAAVDAIADPADSAVLIVSDHGENLGDHGHLAHVFNLYDSNLEVALLARGRGFAPGSRDDRAAQLTDVYPTLLALAGLEIEPGLDGHDLRRPPLAQRVLSASLEFPAIESFDDRTRATGALAPYQRELIAARSDRYKVIRSTAGDEEIYDLERDPGEERPLPASFDVAEVQALRRQLDATDFPGGTPFGGATPEFDDETLRQMRELGYIH
jgi:arylsulfatase A-like enzyme